MTAGAKQQFALHGQAANAAFGVAVTPQYVQSWSDDAYDRYYWPSEEIPWAVDAVRMEQGAIAGPGNAEYIPLVGSGWDAVRQWQRGNLGGAMFSGALTVSDVFLVKSLGQAGLRLTGDAARTIAALMAKNGAGDGLGLTVRAGAVEFNAPRTLLKPTGCSTNCVEVSIATERMLRGDLTARAMATDLAVPFKTITTALGQPKFLMPNVSSVSNLDGTLAFILPQHGDSAIVVASRGLNIPGHSFNVVNHHGRLIVYR